MHTIIIEHPTRGVLREWDIDEFHFSWSGRRDDPEKSCQFYSVQDAQRVLARMPLKLQDRCYILMWDEEKLEWVKVDE